MAAVEASVDRDYLIQGLVLLGAGRRQSDGRTCFGFDAIFDDPNFVGGQFSFWVRNGIRLTQTGVGLVQPNSLLPSLRSSKMGQANFVNPGSLFTTAASMSKSRSALRLSSCELSAVSPDGAAGVVAVSESHSSRHRLRLQSRRGVPAISDQQLHAHVWRQRCRRDVDFETYSPTPRATVRQVLKTFVKPNVINP